MNILLANIQQSTDIDSISVLIIIVTFMALIFGWVLNRITLLRIRQNTERTKDLSTIMQRTSARAITSWCASTCRRTSP